MAEAIVGPLLNKLQEVVVKEAKALAEVGGDIDKLRDKLLWLHALVHEADLRSRHDGSRLVRVLAFQIRDAGFDVEDAVDHFYLQGSLSRRFGRYSWWRISKEFILNLRTHVFVRAILSGTIQSINVRLEEIMGNNSTYNLSGQNGSGDGKTWRASRAIPPMRTDWDTDYSMEFVLKYRRKEREELMDKIKKENLPKVITVAGVEGVGKTALLMHAYKESKKKGFDARIWLSFPPDINDESMFKQIKKELGNKAKEMGKGNLKDVRCLVVIGSPVGTTTWGKVEERLLEMVREDSKILLSVTLSWREVRIKQDSTNKQGPDDSVEETHATIQLRPLDDDSPMDDDSHHSIKLFDLIYGLKRCERTNTSYQVAEMNHIHSTIMEITNGLPLAVVLVARLMRTVDFGKWEAAAAYLKCNSEDSKLKTILSVCVDDLSDELKSCLLYTAGFPENRPIDAHQLVRLWMAEGFLTRQDKMETEELGQCYLKELIYRGLLHLTKRAPGGNVLWVAIPYQIHPLLRSEAQRTSFMDVHYGGSLPPPGNTRRLALHSYNDKFPALDNCLEKLRTVVSYSNDYTDYPYGRKQEKSGKDEHEPEKSGKDEHEPEQSSKDEREPWPEPLLKPNKHVPEPEQSSKDEPDLEPKPHLEPMLEHEPEQSSKDETKPSPELEPNKPGPEPVQSSKDEPELEPKPEPKAELKTSKPSKDEPKPSPNPELEPNKSEPEPEQSSNDDTELEPKPEHKPVHEREQSSKDEPKPRPESKLEPKPEPEPKLVMRKLLQRSPYLRVINLEGIQVVKNKKKDHICALPHAIGEMVHLQYLGVRCRGLKEVPPSIGNLHNLQTIDVRGTDVRSLPDSLWKVKTLRHVLGDQLAFPRSSTGDADHLKLMHTLESVTIDHGSDAACKRQKMKLLRFPFLHRLHVAELKESQGKDLKSVLKHLSFLKALILSSGKHIPMDLFAEASEATASWMKWESLMLDGPLHHQQAASYNGPLHHQDTSYKKLVADPRLGSYLVNVTHLVLRSTDIGQEFIPWIGKLPALAELELLEGSYKDNELTIDTGAFRSLTMLRISGLHTLHKISVSDATTRRKRNRAINMDVPDRVVIDTDEQSPAASDQQQAEVKSSSAMITPPMNRVPAPQDKDDDKSSEEATKTTIDAGNSSVQDKDDSNNEDKDDSNNDGIIKMILEAAHSNNSSKTSITNYIKDTYVAKCLNSMVQLQMLSREETNNGRYKYSVLNRQSSPLTDEDDTLLSENHQIISKMILDAANKGKYSITSITNYIRDTYVVKCIDIMVDKGTLRKEKAGRYNKYLIPNKV